MSAPTPLTVRAAQTVRVTPRRCAAVVLAIGAAILVAEPIAWLIETWRAPVDAGAGAVAAAAVGALALWSLSSPRRPGTTGAGDMDWRRELAIGLVGVTALVRLGGQLLGVHVLSALALAVDVFALAMLFGVDYRSRPLSPGWLAVLFACALPLERIVQRLIGYPLQRLSAEGACLGLGVVHDDLVCAGVRLTLSGQDVLVDLPCSGARGLTLMVTLFAGLAALVRPRPAVAALGLVTAVAAAVVGNVARIVALALGLVHGPALGIDVMAAPWHDAIGLVTLAGAALALLAWAAAVRPLTDTPGDRWPPGRSIGAVLAARPLWVAFGVLVLAVGIVRLPARPVDVAAPSSPPTLPHVLAGEPARPVALGARERAYFARYGGGAVQVGYGAATVLAVRTTAPLRHLHAPDECLAGAGYAVRSLGRSFDPLPTAWYRATAPDGRVWRIAVSFLGDDGTRAASVAEAVWHWLHRPGTGWTMLQRAMPWSIPPAALGRLDAGLLRALDHPMPVAAASPAAASQGVP